MRVWLNYLEDPRFCSVRSLLTTGDLFGAKLNYDLVPRVLDPLDNDTYHRTGGRLTAVLTDVQTGQAVYWPVRYMFGDIRAIQATASLPLISRCVRIDGRKYLDGGVADSIPVRRAIAEGHEKNVLVLTQAPGYRKQPNEVLGLMRLRYARYPRFVEVVARRHERYNETLDFIEAQAAAGRLFILRPDEKPGLDRIERDGEKLKQLHDVGYKAAMRQMDALRAFMRD